MKSPYDSWADSFRFSDDLKALEQVFQAEQKNLLQQQQVQAQNGSEPSQSVTEKQATETTEPVDGLILDMLSVKIAQRLAQFLGEPEVMAHYLKLDELQSDNEVMAKQIDELLAQLRSREDELQDLRKEVQAYHRCFGRVYIKY